MKYSLAVLLAVVATVSAAVSCFFLYFCVPKYCLHLTFQALTEEQKHKTDDHVQACTKEIGITPEAVAKLKAGDFSQKDEKIQVNSCKNKKTY